MKAEDLRGLAQSRDLAKKEIQTTSIAINTTTFSSNSLGRMACKSK
jgi:hypothetical protein